MLLSAVSIPIKIPMRVEPLSQEPIRPTIAPVTNTCAPPPTRTTQMDFFSFAIENSTPMENSSSITPISSIARTSSVEAIRLRPDGPISMPATRKPVIVDRWTALNTYDTTTAEPNRIVKSNKKVSSIAGSQIRIHSVML